MKTITFNSRLTAVERREDGGLHIKIGGKLKEPITVYFDYYDNAQLDEEVTITIASTKPEEEF